LPYAFAKEGEIEKIKNPEVKIAMLKLAYKNGTLIRRL